MMQKQKWGKTKKGQAYPKVKLTMKSKKGSTKSSGIKLPKRTKQKSIDIGHWKGHEIHKDMHHKWTHHLSEDIVEIEPFNSTTAKTDVTDGVDEEVIFIGDYEEAIHKAHEWMKDNPNGWEKYDTKKQKHDAKRAKEKLALAKEAVEADIIPLSEVMTNQSERLINKLENVQRNKS